MRRESSDPERDSSGEGREERDRETKDLDEIVASFADRLNAGERIAPEEILEEHPVHGGEILDQLEVFLTPEGSGAAGRDPEGPLGTGALGTLGDYTLRRQIGRGGMGVVYEAWQNSLNRPVALKVLPAGFAADAKASTRFLREAQIAARIHHPNVVAVHGFGVESNTPYYAMEYVEGETLSQILERLEGAPPNSPTPLGATRDEQEFYLRLARCFADVAEGLQQAHAKGVIHRDIKPSNLILDREGRLRILDFGLARLEGQESLTQSGDLLGTPLYMSPEQARRKKIPIDHRTDIYSLGATMYEMVTLRPPFEGKDHADTLSQIIERDPIDLHRLNSRVPKDLETIVLKCLRKEAADRYGTAEALEQDLRRYSRGEPVEARPCSRWEVIVRRSWRSRRKILATILIGILVVVTSILGLFYRRDRLTRQLLNYEEVVVQSMLRVEMSALPKATSTRLETNTPLPSGSFDLADFEGGAQDLEDAVKELEQQERLFPRRPEAYYQRARVLLALERTEEATAELLRALDGDTDFLPARSVLENLGGNPSAGPKSHSAGSKLQNEWWKIWGGAIEAERRSENRSVIDLTSKLLDGNPGQGAFLGAEIEARLRRANARLKLKDIRAIADLEVVRLRWPAALEPVLLQGTALHLLGHPLEAEEIFEHVLTIFPRKQNMILWVAGVYLNFSEHGRAERWIDRVENAPTRERLRALRLQAIGDHEGAVNAARRAVDLDPGNPRNHRTLSGLFDLRDTPQQAVVLENAVRLFPRNMELKEYLCQIRLRQGRYDEGLALAKEVLQASPRMASTKELMGCCLFQLGRVDEALATLEDAARAPGHTSGEIGWANFNLGRLDEARAAYEAANRRDPHDAWYLRFMGMIEARRDHGEEALAFLTQSLEGYPRDGVPQYNLAVYHEEQGELQEALRRLAESYRIVPRGFPHWRLLNLLRSRQVMKLDLSVLDGLVEDLERAASSTGNSRAKQLLARIILLRSREPENARRALDLCRQAFELEKAAYPELLATFADAQYACGEKAAALRSLEQALLLPHATTSLTEQLDRWRMDLPPEQDLDAKSPLHTMAHVQAARREGRFDEAIALAVQGLEDSSGEARFLGELALLWSQEPTVVEVILAACSQRADREPRQEWSAPIASLRTLLAQIRETGAVRIDCGGRGLQDSSGRAWIPDAFYHGGWSRGVFEEDYRTCTDAYGEHEPGVSALTFGFHGLVTGTSDPDLYRTERWFHPAENRPGYAIPVPPGNYLVRLHFAETWYRAEGLRRFGLLVDGKEVITALDPFGRRGFGVAFAEEVVTTVNDGLLEIEFIADRRYPAVAGIEVVWKR